MAFEPQVIPCRDSTIGRRRDTTIRLTADDRIALIVPQPSGTYDVDEATKLIDALVAARRELLSRTESP